MNNHHANKTKRRSAIIALLLTALIALPMVCAYAETPAVTSVHPGNFDIYDYFLDVYGLGADKAYKNGEEAYYYSTFFQKTINERGVTINNYHPFSTLLYEEFQYLLQSQYAADQGYYAVVFGGEWEANTQPVLENVNLVAGEIAAANNAYSEDSRGNQVKQDDAFINTIYNFDFKLNGGVEIEERLAEYGFTVPAEEYNSDIRADQVAYGSGDARRTVTNLYKTLYDTLNVAEGTFSSEKVTVLGGAELADAVAELEYIPSPSVVLLKKEDIGAGAVKNTVVGFIDASATDFTDAAQTDAFKADVKNLLGKATAGLREFDFFRYIWGTFTLDFTSEFTGLNYSAQFANLTDPNHIFETVSYAELVHILQQEGNYAIYFGGAWCPYSKGFLAPLNQIAKSYDVNKIYVYDPRIDGIGGNTMIRATETASGLYQRLYAYLMTYLGVDYNSFAFPSSHDYLSPKLGVTDEDILIAGKSLTKIGVPTLISYNRDNVDANGQPAHLSGTASTADTFSNIIIAATEPTKYGTQVTVAEPKEGVQYYAGVSYIEVFRTSIPGRREENNAIRFFDDFFEGRLTYVVK
ncbi:MAG: hypothetical protein LBD16_09410 [Oscillospiraceae bacterium]|jgi:hypothetical protein|nr:hypothetical protein [Oscillospiraceae bacterium]